MNKTYQPLYNHNDLANTWSEISYEKYKKSSSTWLWKLFPKFNNRENLFVAPQKKIDGSILEIGCAAGGAFDFLTKNNTLKEGHDYNGFDISNTGINYCKEKYPTANWTQADITALAFNRKYDYGIERNAIHHMPKPLDILGKALDAVDKSFATSFVSCINGSTISDLSIARYRHGNGNFVYFNIINIFEAINLMLESGFNEIDVLNFSIHEKCYSDPLAHQYISPEIDQRKRIMSRCTLIGTRSNGKTKLNFIAKNPTQSYFYSSLKSLKYLLTGQLNKEEIIRSRLLSMENLSYGVLYKSAYQPY
jgi:2-polyprenyl-3-methyl-5-hydroxy-6-metoxy-1,4-benzoquinol methylase